VCYKYLLVLGFPLGLGTILVGEHIIRLVYGDGFDGAIPFLYILALFLFTIVGYSNGSLLNATGQQTFFAWTEGVAVGVNVIGSLILVPLIGPIGSAIAFVASGVGTFFVHSRASHQSLGMSIPWLTILRVALATGLMGVVVVIALQFGVPWLAVALGIGPLAYSLALLGLGLLRWDELKLLSSARNA
jgi:O-antigen/teichoic acid export membrane protein